MSMYTDPDHIRVEDPGKIEGNMVFHYLDVFGRPEDAQEIAEMKEHYQRGGLGDVKTKRYLLEILERELGPIRERRIEFAKDMGEVYNMLQKVVKERVKLQVKPYLRLKEQWDFITLTKFILQETIISISKKR